MTVRLGLEGRSAFVTGPASEIGRACVERLREEGMAIVDSLDAVDEAGLDVLVTAPAMFAEGSIEATGEARFRELVDANLTAVFKVARACFGPMRASGGGSMIHIASDAGIRAAHESSAFSVTSAGVIALAELFAAEGGAHGIRSNAICPRAGTDVASLVAWLASDESAHVNGATLRVDDGAGAAMVIDTRA